MTRIDSNEHCLPGIEQIVYPVLDSVGLTLMHPGTAQLPPDENRLWEGVVISGERQVGPDVCGDFGETAQWIEGGQPYLIVKERNIESLVSMLRSRLADVEP